MGVIYTIACKSCYEYLELGKSRYSEEFMRNVMRFLEDHNCNCELQFFNDHHSCYLEEEIVLNEDNLWRLLND